MTDVWGQLIPEELLFHVFKLGGSLRFLCRVSQVCTLWHRISKDPCLWTKLDLTRYRTNKKINGQLRWLIDNRLSKVKEIDLSNTRFVRTKTIKYMAEMCPELESIKLPGFHAVNDLALERITAFSTRLQAVDLSKISHDVLSSDSMEQFIIQRGPFLKHLTNRSGFNRKILDLVQTTCTHLEYLELSFGYLDISVFLSNLTNMKTLKLMDGYLHGTTKVQLPICLPMLEKVDLDCIYIDDHALEVILKSCPNLHVLDMCIMKGGTCSNLKCLPMLSLEQLHVSDSIGSSCCFSGLDEILLRCTKTLRHLGLPYHTLQNLHKKDLLKEVSMPKLETVKIFEPCVYFEFSGDLECAAFKCFCKHLKFLFSFSPNLIALTVPLHYDLSKNACSYTYWTKMEYKGDKLAGLKQMVDTMN